MKKNKYLTIILVSLFFVFLMTSLLPNKSHAYEFWGNKWANPQTLLFYVDSVTINSNYESVSVWGATAWNTSSKVEVTRTTNPLSDDGRTTSIVTSTTDLGNIVAEAYVYNSSGSRCTYGMSCTSVKGKIVINKPEFQLLQIINKQETMTHEMGHILGLAHEDDDWINSIMTSEKYINQKSPQLDDYSGITARY